MQCLGKLLLLLLMKGRRSLFVTGSGRSFGFYKLPRQLYPSANE